jgi:exosortase/archaeosortase family protein
VSTPRFPVPERRPRSRRSTRDLAIVVARMVGALALAIAGAVVFLQQSVMRKDEAFIAGHWFDTFLNGPVHRSRDAVYISWQHGSAIGIRITSECTVALLIGPLFLLSAALLAFARPTIPRLLAGLLLGLVTVVVVNQLRLGIIAISMQHWGMAGYHVSHTFIGTVVALAGFVIAALAMLKIALVRGSHART